MKKEDDFWERFERTGKVMDYLSYTACAKEEGKESYWSGYECKDERGSDGNGNGAFRDAGGRL
ncbi:MAG: hypothetical protein J6B85_10225 [Lachnospiraceae bacterium]|nr:hypothetical protein [Lachnospiraceae bacterium]